MSMEIESILASKGPLEAIRRVVARHGNLGDELSSIEWKAYAYKPDTAEKEAAYVRCLLRSLLAAREPMNTEEYMDCSRIMLALAPNGDHAA